MTRQTPCLAILLASVASGQNTIPNPNLSPNLSPWVSAGSGTAIALNNNWGALLSQGGKIEINGKFFGQGNNVILLRAGGVRDAAARQASLAAGGAYVIHNSTFSKSFSLSTAAKPGPNSLAKYGPAVDIAWVTPVTPTGNGTGKFWISTDDPLGVTVTGVFAFQLRHKNHLPPGAAAGYGELKSGYVLGSQMSNLYQVTDGLNGATGYSTSQELTIAAYAPTGFSRIDFEGMSGDASSLAVSLYDFVAGKWAAGKPSAPPPKHLGVEFNLLPLKPVFTATSLLIPSANRFVDSATGVALVRIAPLKMMANTTTNTPPTYSIRQFRLN